VGVVGAGAGVVSAGLVLGAGDEWEGAVVGVEETKVELVVMSVRNDGGTAGASGVAWPSAFTAAPQPSCGSVGPGGATTAAAASTFEELSLQGGVCAEGGCAHVRAGFTTNNSCDCFNRFVGGPCVEDLPSPLIIAINQRENNPPTDK
jgi:hypothetical protein